MVYVTSLLYVTYYENTKNLHIVIKNILLTFAFFGKTCKTLEQSNKATARLLALVSQMLNITIGTRPNLRESSYFNIKSIRNFFHHFHSFLYCRPLHLIHQILISQEHLFDPMCSPFNSSFIVLAFRHFWISSNGLFQQYS